jgi:hypothetical protein
MTAPTGIDTREMVVVHTAFRRELGAAPGLVRGVAAGDRARSQVVGDHVQLLLDMLHHHHVGEDDLLWPKLLERVPAELAPRVRLMEGQHELIAQELDVAAIPKPRLPMVFGMLMAEGEPEVLRAMIGHAPLLPRLVVPRIAPRAYGRYTRQVQGVPRQGR